MVILDSIVTFPAATTREEIEDRLRLLQSDDERTRHAAFASIKDCSKSDLRAAWQSARQLQPKHGGTLDCFGRVEVLLDAPIVCDRAIVTVITSGGDWEHWLRLLLESLEKFGDLGNTKVIVFCVGECLEAVRAWSFPFVVAVPCIARERASTMVKGAIYSCAQWIEAPTILSLESDMLCLTALEPLWRLLEAAPENALCGVKPQFFAAMESVGDVLTRLNAGPSGLDFLFGEGADGPFYWNGGLLAGKRAAWQTLASRLEDYAPFSLIWMEGGFPLWFGEEVLMNRASHLSEAVDLPPGWNAQVGEPVWGEEVEEQDGRYFLVREGTGSEEAKILHFLAGGRGHMDRVAGELGLA